MDGTTIRLFVDGVLASTETTDGIISWAADAGSHRLACGIVSGAPHFWEGCLDEFRVSSIARYSADFAPPLYAFENDQYTEALYHFDEGTGGDLNDASDHGHDGTLMNGPQWIESDALGPLPGTTVCGDVSGIWDLTGSPYYVTCDVTVPAGQTLEIGPGVQVLFMGHYKFNVFGNLQATGTEEDPVFFTTDTLANPDCWDGIKFSGSASSASQLSYCLIENGLSVSEESHEGAGVRCGDGASPSFSHCTIARCRARWGGGASVNTGSSPTFDHCTFRGNSAQACGGAIEVVDDGQTTISHCTFVGNWGEGWDQAAVCIARSTVTVSSSIVAFGADYGVVFEDAPNSHLEFCDIYGNSLGNIRFWNGPQDGPPNVGQISGTNWNGDPCDQYQNIFLNPLFVDMGNGNFHLQAGSPCIDGGDRAVFDPDCTPSDIGAFYFFHLAQPDSLIIQQQGNDMMLWWSVVDSTECGLPSPIRSYVIYFEEELSEDWDFLAATMDTFYTHENVALFAPSMYYEVVATDVEIGLVRSIAHEGMSRSEFQAALLRMQR
jgi:hypothetical protein